MTDLLYQIDSYLRVFEAEITAVDVENRTVTLDRSAFYPGGGGQPNDTGTLTVADMTFPVLKVKKGLEGVLHFLGGDNPMPAVGQKVTGEINWDRRYQLMRTHTAMHVLCGVIFHDYGAQVTGGDMDPLQGRMDFEFETMSKDLVGVIEARVNEEIQKRHDVHVKILPREEAFQIPDLIRTKINLLPPAIQEIRTVELVGLDLQADGGTHVKNTIEVGSVKVVDYKSKGKINKRIYVDIV